MFPLNGWREALYPICHKEYSHVVRCKNENGLGWKNKLVKLEYTVSSIFHLE